MLHIVPILCLIFFIFFVEYRLQRHITKVDEELQQLKKKVKQLHKHDNLCNE